MYKKIMNSIIFSKQGIDISVSVYTFKEGNVFIAYCPSLDLSGYDTTEEKAKEDFQYMLKEYLHHQLQNNTLQQDLKRHGWSIGIRKYKEPELKDMLDRNRQLRNVVSLPAYSKINVNTVCPAIA